MPAPVSRLAASGPTPSRRAVVRGSAWTAPLLVVSTAAPAFAASTCTTSYSYRLNWGTTEFTRVSATSASARIVSSTLGGPDIYAVFAVQKFGNNTPDPTRNLTVPSAAGSDAQLDPAITNLGNLGAGERGVRLQNQSSGAGRDNRQQLTVTFRRNSTSGPIVNAKTLTFWVTDIDAVTTSPYADRVELSGTFNQTRDANIRGAGTSVAENNNNVGPWRNSDTNNNQGENNAGARVQVAYTADTSAFTLVYWNNASPGTQYHRIFLSDFVFTSTGCAIP